MADFPKLPRIKQQDEDMEKMHCAARRGQTELVRRLVSTGIDPQIQNKFGCTALHVACKHGQIGCTRELCVKGDLSGLWHGQRPLHLAVQSGKLEVVQVLIEGAKERGIPIDHFVAENDEYELFAINGTSKHVQGQTALHVAVAMRNPGMIKLLVGYGASPTAKDKNNETVFMRCIELNLEEQFAQLLDLCPGIRLEVCDRGGRTPLHWALRHNRPSMAKKLIDRSHDFFLGRPRKGASSTARRIRCLSPTLGANACEHGPIHHSAAAVGGWHGRPGQGRVDRVVALCYG